MVGFFCFAVASRRKNNPFVSGDTIAKNKSIIKAITNAVTTKNTMTTNTANNASIKLIMFYPLKYLLKFFSNGGDDGS